MLARGRPLSELAVRTALGQDTVLSQAALVTVAAVDLTQYDALWDGNEELSRDRPEEPSCVGAEGRSGTESNEEGPDECGTSPGVDTLSAGVAPAGDARAARGGSPAGDGGVVGLPELPAGVGPTGVPAAAATPDRAAAEGLEAAVGEELVGVGPEAAAAEGGATVAGPVGRGLPGTAGQ